MNPHRKAEPLTKGILPPDPAPKEDPNEAEIEMSLRLMCSMSGNRSKAFWEDVTETTPMTVALKTSPGSNLDNKYNLSPAGVRQDPSTAVDLKKPFPGSNQFAEFEDRSPGTVQFTSLVSASFWLVYCPNWMSSDVISLVDQIYKV